MGLGETLRAFIDPYESAAYEDDDDPEVQEPRPGGEQQGRQERRLRAVEKDRHRGHERRSVFLISAIDFDDAQQIADRLKDETPVIIDLGSCTDDLSRRLLDFCSGLAYALEAGLHFLGESVVLLAPPGVELSGGAAGASPRFFNQV